MSNFLVVAARNWFSARHTHPQSQLHLPTCPEFSWRGSAIPSRLPLKFTSRSCVISFANLSADLMNTAELHGRTSPYPRRWLGIPTPRWRTSTIFWIFLVVGTVPRQSSGCSARLLLVALMTSSSLFSLLPDCVAESSFFSAGCITCSPDPSRL